MASFKIHAGDFPQVKVSALISSQRVVLSFPWQAGDGFSTGKTVVIEANDIEDLAPASEENVKRLGGTVGWGIVGATVLGPVGLLAGLLAGGKGKDVTFILKTKEGNKMLATTDSKTFTKLQSLVF